MSEENETPNVDVWEGLEPKEYFDKLKEQLNVSDFEKLQAQLESVGAKLIEAKELGLDSATHKLAFLFQTIIKEQLLLTQGFNLYVYKDDVLKFIDGIKPKDAVKICELSRFPRLIPSEPAKLLKKARDLNVFDDLFVIYTDFTNEDIKTPAETAMVARNRDPIILGSFNNPRINFKHDRLYFVADWEDEFCDLTFTKMIEKMSALGIANPEKQIAFDHEYLNTLSNDALLEAETAVGRNRFSGSTTIPSTSLVELEVKKKSWVAKLLFWIKSEQ